MRDYPDAMRVEAWDQVFIRARRADVHPLLRDPGHYGRWWPGASSVIGADGTARLVLAPRTLGARVARRTQELDVTVVKDRADLGVDMAYRGTLEGAAEWYYLDETAGTVVHYVLHADAADRAWRRTLAEHRACVRAALAELKDRLEGARVPGAEPDPGLLADQQAALAAFQAGVEAWAAKQARPKAEA